MAAKYVPFFESFYNATKDLSDERRLRIYDSLLAYGFHGEFPELSDDEALDMAFKRMLPNVDATLKRCESNKKAGEASGASRRKRNNG